MSFEISEEDKKMIGRSLFRFTNDQWTRLINEKSTGTIVGVHYNSPLSTGAGIAES